ncbi:MAG: NUDIX hydrolase [Algoriphagus sp.]|jgi:ADP-ribose pyrophosphatase|uniref:NUDIX domain-containing protein n=1 Tax=Algoriphagus sp. TaxID=1872435 RepID=UPI0027544B54|nr:NUDIX hydrolase [Algoriphagus sp.]MDP4747913.1 NUDIX hydrolase [Algoriphagus sp.]MDP4839341.1 NUDIX hydrolase [Algoriphagus sp.]MDP4904393.1 NUDIX hydrolase [Algoriphagus sp.]MDP4956157.1 NUDIX hydrolase [Algoriphagus sp.]
MTENPWKTKSITTAYENSWIRVEHHEVLTPSGKDGIYGKTHFKNKAIAILPLDEEGNTWLVGQYRYALDSYSWEVPMGGGPLELDTLASAQRELKEETGLSANRWTELQLIHTSNSVTDEVGYIFLAQELTEGKPEFEDTEDITIQKLPFKEALDWVMQGKITDSLSVIAIFRVARALGY